ncbi:hypothetical protein D3C85_1396720 [compost metagenome]
MTIMKIGIDTSNSMLKNLAARAKPNDASLENSAALANQIKSDAEASKALDTDDEKNLAKIKEIVKGYDFTSITQKELAELSVKLYNKELIDLETTGHLSLGDANFNADGTAITDTKFNALEVFSNNLKGQKIWASGATSVEGIYNAKAEVAKTNKAVGVLFSLAYFSNSNASNIGVNEKA